MNEENMNENPRIRKSEYRYKVVNAFNGAVYDYCKTEQEGETLMRQIRKEYYSHPGTQDDDLKFSVVPVEYDWYWHERSNRFEWSE